MVPADAVLFQKMLNLKAAYEIHFFHEVFLSFYRREPGITSNDVKEDREDKIYPESLYIF
jgi:transcriptional regulator of met regulon